VFIRVNLWFPSLNRRFRHSQLLDIDVSELDQTGGGAAGVTARKPASTIATEILTVPSFQ
jgi:hypothetical protein